MASVNITEKGDVAGIWVSADDNQIGIVGKDGHGAYIVFYNTKNMGTPVALKLSDINTDGVDDLVVQIPSGDTVKAKQFNLSKILENLSKLSS